MQDTKPVLITGGAGFIGSHVVDELLARGRAVVVLDDLSVGKRENLPAAHPRLRFVHGSALDPVLLADAMAGCSAIAHLAAVASVQASFASPRSTHTINVGGTIATLEAAKASGASRFIFSSSAAVYGDSSHSPLSEDTVCAPMSPYAIDKLACEKYVRVLSHAWNMDYSVLRFFNVFGPRQSDTSDYAGVVHKFADAALAKRGILVYGDGKQTRDFVFVRDIARMIADAIERPELVGRIVNVGTGNPTSLHDLIAALEKILGRTLTVSYLPQRVGDIRNSTADVRLMHMLLGQTPTTTIEAGLRELIKSLVADPEKKANYI